MALVRPVFLLLCLIAALFAVEKGYARFDFGIGLQSSPFSPLYLESDLPVSLIEFSATNLHSFSLTTADERLFHSEWGMLWGKGRRRWTWGIHYFDAFDLLKEWSISNQFSLAFSRRVSLWGSSEFRMLSVPEDRDSEWDFATGPALHLNHITVAVSYGVSHLSSEPLRSIPMGNVQLHAVFRENVLGAQGMKIIWNHTDKTGTVQIAQKYTVAELFSLYASIQTEPFEIGLGVQFHLGNSNSGFSFRRHSKLGWSHTALLQIQKRSQTERNGS